MKYRRPSLPPSGVGRSNRPSHLLRWLLVLVLLATVTESLFFSAALPERKPAPAALPTSPAEVAKLSSNLQIDLPNTKAEAAAFERLHHSPYNFEQVRLLNANYVGSDTVTLNQSASAATTPAAPLTPSPTSAGWLPSQDGTLTPTANGSDGAFRSNSGTPTCYSTPPAGTPDSCEPDNSTLEATYIYPNDTPQIHNFITSIVLTSTVPELDYFKFVVTTAYVPYTINVKLQSGTVVPSVVLQDVSLNVVATGTALPSNIVTISNFVATTTGTYYIRVLPVAGSIYTDQYSITLTSGVALPTPTSTSTPTPTGTPPTSTPAATGTPSTCRDSYEYDGTPDRATLLKPSDTNLPPLKGTPGAPPVSDALNAAGQAHFICPVGDVDWVYMDLVKGKPYSIFTKDLKNGLDTFIILYLQDAAGNMVPLYSSDDYPSNALGSRIDWIVPTTPNTALGEFARYYLAVKDVAGHGGDNMSYNLFLTSTGNGLGDCFDQYEPDNNPAQAKDILLNESQSHSICPTGDRDWVRFYAKGGKLYNINTSFQAATSLGLDTSIYIWQVSFDPNDPTKLVGQNLISQNDDRSDSDLTSSTNFSVPADGYYYVEVRNAGDIGQNGLYYTLNYTTSSGAPLDVGATRTARAIAATQTAFAQTAAATETATDTSATLGTGTTTGTVTTTAIGTATLAPGAIVGLLSKMHFSDAGFQQLWVYSDLAVATGQTQRSWEWGPSPATTKLEPYVEASGGIRQVQYFDKARMEINNPKGDRNSKWFISNGLLVKELVTGWQATGDTQAELHGAAEIAVAGDLINTNQAPTYASFLQLITQNGTNRAESRTGQTVTGFLSKDGKPTTLTTPPEQVKLETYIKETGHNIPSVFWSYLNAQGLVYGGSDYKQGSVRDWVFSMGLPLSEPFWIKAQVDGVEKDVLVQLFERRVLTYTPANTPDWRVEMSNVGQHYYLWRYSARLEAAG
ncbi:MAG: PPC domain-containing protein [Chloroflexi bacterium]|nr:PPC domain-containing protein [Chloroflexota bacterium]